MSNLRRRIYYHNWEEDVCRHKLIQHHVIKKNLNGHMYRLFECWYARVDSTSCILVRMNLCNIMYVGTQKLIQHNP